MVRKLLLAAVGVGALWAGAAEAARYVEFSFTYNAVGPYCDLAGCAGQVETVSGGTEHFIVDADLFLPGTFYTQTTAPAPLGAQQLSYSASGFNYYRTVTTGAAAGGSIGFSANFGQSLNYFGLPFNYSTLR